MPMGSFDYRGNGSPDFNLRSSQPLPTAVARPMPVPPTIGHPGGNERPPQPTGDPRQRMGPTPNANAYEHANANARFMRTDADGNRFADNPAGQRPGLNQNAMDNADPRANFLNQLQNAMVPQNENEEFRRRKFMQDLLMRTRGALSGGQMAPPLSATNWMPPSYNQQPGGTGQYAPPAVPYPQPSVSPFAEASNMMPASYNQQPPVTGMYAPQISASNFMPPSYNQQPPVTGVYAPPEGGGYQPPPQPYSFPAAPLPVQQPNYDRQTIYDLLSQMA